MFITGKIILYTKSKNTNYVTIQFVHDNFCRYMVVSQPPDQLEFNILFCINRNHNENCSHLKYNHAIS